MRLEDLSPEHQAQARAQLDGTPAPAPEPAAPEPPTKLEIKAEKELQQTCENWLSLHGYVRMTAHNAAGPRPERGWFGHWFNSVRNPLMPDLAILDHAGRCLLVELKTRDVYQPGQREMIDAGFWRLAWTFEEFEQILREWTQVGATDKLPVCTCTHSSGNWFSRTDPMGYVCNDCSNEVKEGPG